MNYEDLLKSNSYMNSMSASYFNSVAPIVQVFKLAKDEMKLNPIYNEELGSTRKYLRPYELHSVYKTNQFSWSFDNTIPKEVDNDLIFYFNFNSMVQTANSLKQSACTLKISAIEDGWRISKSNDCIRLYKINSIDELMVDLNTYTTLDEVAQFLNLSGKFMCLHDDDDYSKAIPDFKECEIRGSIILKTFNLGFKDVTNTIDQGDLIYIPTTNALYEVNSAYPTNNTMYKYITWECNATRTHAYVNYEALKAYKFGLDDINGLEVTNTKQEPIVSPKPTVTTFSADDLIKLMCGEADTISVRYEPGEEPPVGPLSPEKLYLTGNEIYMLLEHANDLADKING